MSALADAAPGRAAASTLTYHVTALQMPIYFNREGDHDHNGLIFALTENVSVLKFIRALSISNGGGALSPEDDPETWRAEAEARAAQIDVTLPATAQQARQPHPWSVRLCFASGSMIDWKSSSTTISTIVTWAYTSSATATT